MTQPADPHCVPCGHVANLHRLDDAQNVGPCEPGALFRCIYPGPDVPGPLRRDCFCPDFVVPPDAGWPYNDAPDPADVGGAR